MVRIGMFGCVDDCFIDRKDHVSDDRGREINSEPAMELAAQRGGVLAGSEHLAAQRGTNIHALLPGPAWRQPEFGVIAVVHMHR